MLTRKHFVAKSVEIRAILLAQGKVAAQAEADAFARVAKWNNPRFDLERFNEACGLVPDDAA